MNVFLNVIDSETCKNSYDNHNEDEGEIIYPDQICAGGQRNKVKDEIFYFDLHRNHFFGDSLGYLSR